MDQVFLLIRRMAASRPWTAWEVDMLTGLVAVVPEAKR
jgi:hypothetical protein